MAPRKRKEENTKIKLKQPDRSGPTEKTLLELAQERELFAQADERQQKLNKQKKSGGDATTNAEDDDDDNDDEVLSPTGERIMETLLWTTSIAMLHVTLDVLVQNQFAMEIVYLDIAKRAGQAFLVFAFLFYNLHPHSSSPRLLPGLPLRHQPALRQAIFFATSVSASCYLIYITNEHGYLAVMKRAPPIGCLWVWSVIELNLTLSVLELVLAYAFLRYGGYSIK